MAKVVEFRSRKKRQGGEAPAPKAATAIDQHVGSRVRMQRLLAGMSQTALGEAVGVTFQQIQKYENGTNRIGASRLHEIARVLGVPVQFFYEGAAEQGGSAGPETGVLASEISKLLNSSEGIELVRAFAQIQDPAVRRHVVGLVQNLARNPGKRVPGG